MKKMMIALCLLVASTASAGIEVVYSQPKNSTVLPTGTISNISLYSVVLTKFPTETQVSEYACFEDSTCTYSKVISTTKVVEAIVTYFDKSQQETAEVRLQLPASDFTAEELALIKSRKGAKVTGLKLAQQTKVVDSIDYGKSELCQSSEGPLDIPGCVPNIVTKEVTVTETVVSFVKK